MSRVTPGLRDITGPSAANARISPAVTGEQEQIEVQRVVQRTGADGIEVAVAGEMEEGIGWFGLADLQALLVAHCLELGTEVLDLVQKLQGQRGARQVDAKIALQVHGDSRAAHLYPREAPMLGLVFFVHDIRCKQALVHQFNDITGLH